MVLSKNASYIDCKNSLLRSEIKNIQIVGLGLDDMIAIAMSDAVLVAKKDRSQDVKKVVDYLKHKNLVQAEIYPKDHRPWGWFETLVSGTRFQVKKIFVNIGASLSLQSHKYRSEHWIVVEGIARVTIESNVKILKEGQSIYVPVGSIHRLQNNAKIPLIVIEIQTGSYLGEDDIKRFEDIYSRK